MKRNRTQPRAAREAQTLPDVAHLVREFDDIKRALADRVLKQRPEPKHPLFEGRQTFCVPWDPWPITIETRVYASGCEGEENGMERVEKIGELERAGWRVFDAGSLEVVWRIIAP